KADSGVPSLCSSKDLKDMRAVWIDMERKGFDRARYKKGIGIIGGDCIKPYSLEESAGRRHKEDAPMPSCGIIFILNPELEAEQAAWILDTVGSYYTTKSGISMRLCSRVSIIGPHPGVTVHN
ncbi:MAG TPA: hypothetical protein VIG33_18080, partial [Pseudobdellovibrionaceae bacterium]